MVTVTPNRNWRRGGLGCHCPYCTTYGRYGSWRDFLWPLGQQRLTMIGYSYPYSPILDYGTPPALRGVYPISPWYLAGDSTSTYKPRRGGSGLEWHTRHHPQLTEWVTTVINDSHVAEFPIYFSNRDNILYMNLNSVEKDDFIRAVDHMNPLYATRDS